MSKWVVMNLWLPHETFDTYEEALARSDEFWDRGYAAIIEEVTD